MEQRNFSRSRSARNSSLNQPNCWQRRQQMQEHLLKIRPKNETDEQEQLQMALELSRKQIEIDENQRKIAILEEEICKTAAAEGVNLATWQHCSEHCSKNTHDSSDVSDTRQSDDEKIKKFGTDLNCPEESNKTSNTSAVNSEKDAVLGPVIAEVCKASDHNNEETKNASDNINRVNEKFNKALGNEDDLRTLDISADCSKIQKPAPWKCSRKKNKSRTKSLCPYGRNCCLGKRCTYYHPPRTGCQRNKLFEAIPNHVTDMKLNEGEAPYLKDRKQGKNNKDDFNDSNFDEVQENLKSLSITAVYEKPYSSFSVDSDYCKANSIEAEPPAESSLSQSIEEDQQKVIENGSSAKASSQEEILVVVSDCNPYESNERDSSQCREDHQDSSSPTGEVLYNETSGDSICNVSNEFPSSLSIEHRPFSTSLAAQARTHNLGSMNPLLVTLPQTNFVSNHSQMNCCDINGLQQEQVCENSLSLNENSSKLINVSVKGSDCDLVDHEHGVSPGQTMHQTTVSINRYEKDCGKSNTAKLHKQVHYMEKLVQQGVVIPDSSFHQLRQIEDSNLKRPIAANTFVPIERQGQKSHSGDDAVISENRRSVEFRNAQSSVISVNQDPTLRRFSKHSDFMGNQEKLANVTASASQVGQALIGPPSKNGSFNNQQTTNQSSAPSLMNIQKVSGDYPSATTKARQEEATLFKCAGLNTKSTDFLDMHSNVNVCPIPNIYSPDMYTGVPGLPQNVLSYPFTQPFFNVTVAPGVDPSVNFPSPLLQTCYQTQPNCLMGQMGQFGSFVQPNKHACPIPTAESSGSTLPTTNGSENESRENNQASVGPQTTGQAHYKQNFSSGSLRRPVTVPRVLQKLRGK